MRSLIRHFLHTISLTIRRECGHKKVPTETARSRPKNFELSSIPSSFRVQLICIKGTRSSTTENSEANSATAAKQPTNQRSCAGSDADVDHVAVTPIEAWAPGNVCCRPIPRCAVITRDVRTAMVSPACARCGIRCERQTDREHQKHHYGDQKLFHMRFRPFKYFNLRRDVC